MNRTKKTRILLAIVCISLVQALQFAMSPVLGEVQARYSELSATRIQLLVTLPTLPSMIMAIISGWLVVKISKKKLLLIGCFVTGVTGILPFLSDSFGMLMFSRVFYGTSLGIALVMNTAIVAEFFEGAERVAVMGIQSASVGASLIFVNVASGFLGRLDFRYACLLNVLGFVAMAVIFLCLPDTGRVQTTKENKITINAGVIRLSVFVLLETLFVTAYTTNIAMHISHNLTTDTGVPGTMSGIFSVSQLLIGLVLGKVVKVAKRYTLPMAIFFMSVGGALFILLPSSFIGLGIGSMFCGLSQGIFVPQASVELTNLVPPAAVTFATAVFTCMMNFGQLICPTVLNTTSRVVLGEESTSNAFLVMLVAAIVAAVAMAIIWTYVLGKSLKKKESY